MNNARIQPPASPAAQRPWGARLARLWTYFSEYRLGWALAIAGTLISALTEASVPALLKPLLDEGFTQGSLPIWTVPLAIVGLYQAVFMANAGGAWDNAKKIVETELRAKGTALHDASIVGDTVGDPFKDTSSVAMNPIIKFTTLFGLLAVEMAVGLVAQGQRADGAAVTVQGVWFARAMGPQVRLYHAVVYTAKPRPDVADAFFAGLTLH